MTGSWCQASWVYIFCARKPGLGDPPLVLSFADGQYGLQWFEGCVGNDGLPEIHIEDMLFFYCAACESGEVQVFPGGFVLFASAGIGEDCSRCCDGSCRVGFFNEEECPGGRSLLPAWPT